MMSTSKPKVDSTTMKESKDTLHSLDLKEIEEVFGTPNSPRTGASKPDEHFIMNERNGRQPHNPKTDDVEILTPTHPLLDPDREKKPPLADPEVDDIDLDSQPDASPYPGIDDGLLVPNAAPAAKPEGHDGDSTHKEGSDHHSGHDEGVGTDDGKWWPSSGGDEADYPYDINGLENRFDDRPISPMPSTIPDVNTYQQKKNLAQGMMDLALLSANANQLRYVLESAANHQYYYFSLTAISLSIILQIAVGVGLILNSRYNVKDEKDICKADKINNMTVIGIFLITIVNVFITSFSVAPTNSGVAVVPAG